MGQSSANPGIPWNAFSKNTVAMNFHEDSVKMIGFQDMNIATNAHDAQAFGFI